jgi:hypothetical protein
MRSIGLTLLAVASFVLGGCSAIGDIFKAGAWVGIVVTIACIAVIGGVVAIFKK